MAVFSSDELKRRLDLRPWNPKSLVITPLFDDADIFDTDSVDLRLGCHFLLPKGLQAPYYAPDKKTPTTLYTRAHVPLGDYLVVPAHQTVLGATLEFIKLPYDASGEVLTKSSIARTFIVVETAPWIHPEYRGCLTLEIANVSNTPVLLYPGRAIAQLVLLSGTPSRPRRKKIQGAYFGPVYPEPPVFHDPKDDLLKLGQRSTWTIERKNSAELDRIAGLEQMIQTLNKVVADLTAQNVALRKRRGGV